MNYQNSCDFGINCNRKREKLYAENSFRIADRMCQLYATIKGSALLIVAAKHLQKMWKNLRFHRGNWVLPYIMV